MAKANKYRPMTASLVPLEKRLRRLRGVEAKRRRQLDRVQARVARTTDEMTALLAAVRDWTEQRAEATPPAVRTGATARPDAGPAQPARPGILRFIGA